MNKKWISLSLLTIVGLISIFIACKKQAGDQSDLSGSTLPAKAGRRSSGEVTYYSKNTGDSVYKMILSINEDGDVTAYRSMYRTSRPDTFKVGVYASGGARFEGYTYNADSNRYYGDTLSIHVPAGKTYYVIPFVLGTNPVARPNFSGMIFWCLCMCLDYKQCDYCLGNGPSDETLECVGICDDNCIVVCDDTFDNPGGGTARVNQYGGCVIVDANGVNVID